MRQTIFFNFIPSTPSLIHKSLTQTSHIFTMTPEKSSFSDEIDDAVLQELYTWVDKIPLTRPKKNLTRDFSDGVLVAETIHHYFPKLVEIHNYIAATSTRNKMENWHVLNRKVFKKLHFELADDVIKQVVNCKPFVIERVLLMLRTKIDTIMWERQKNGAQNDQPEADQHKQDGILYSYPSTPVIQNYRNDLTPRQPGKQTKKSIATSNKQVSIQKPQSQTPAQGGDLYRTPQLIGGVSMPVDLVPRIQLEEKIQDCLAKEETIQILEAKVRRMEHLLHLKDIRINELQSTVDGVRPTGMR